MFAVTGITGQVGGAVARRLLERGLPVRAVLRDQVKAPPWVEHGCEIALAEMTDPEALTQAFAGCEGVFILVPPNFDPSPGFREVEALVIAVTSALRRAAPRTIVCLSTIGAQATELNLLTQLGLVEQAVSRLGLPVAFLRAGWFMENAASDLKTAKKTGLFESYLQPLDRPFPMVATSDVGHAVADLLGETWKGRRVVELEGPRRVTPDQVGAAMAEALGRRVRVHAVPRREWEERFRAGGARNPGPRARMLDGFNEGWIEFEAGETGSVKGATSIETVLRGLAART
jgi:uncharacterized protein YbjT (DUF2867 family)